MLRWRELTSVSRQLHVPLCRGIGLPVAGLRLCSSTETKPKELPLEQWDSLEARVAFIENVAAKLGVGMEEVRDTVSADVILSEGGRSLLARYAGSLGAVLDDLREKGEGEIDVEVQSRRTSLWRAPRGFWEDERNRRDFLRHVAAVHGIEKPEDWRKVGRSEMVALGGGSFLRRYSDSLLSALRDTFPEETFDERCCRPQVSRGYWNKMENRRKFLQEIAEDLDIKRAREWRRVTTTDVAERGGSRLLHIYNGSLHEALMDIFPEQEFDALLCRPTKPAGYWDSKEHRRAFLDDLAAKKDIKCPQDWKKVTAKDVAAAGGGTLLRYYQGSLQKALADLYRGVTYQGTPIRWDAMTCRPNLPAGYWGMRSNVRELLDKVKERYNVKRTKDWYRVSQEQVRQLHGGGMLKKMRFVDALRMAYTDEEFDVAAINKNVKKAAQRQVLMCTRRVFGGLEVVEEFKSEKLAGNARGGWPRQTLELDVWVPELELGIEYNGEHHYHEKPFFGPLDVYLRRDAEKRELCARQGIKLLVVPYWWDKCIQSFVSSLHAAFPEMVEAAAERADGSSEKGAELKQLVAEIKEGKWRPIPLQPSEGLTPVKSNRKAAPQGDKTWHGALPRPMLARRREDGIRVVWHGADGQLATRYGKKIRAPAWWVSLMPVGHEIDGELCLKGHGGSASQLTALVFLTSGFAEGDENPATSRWQAVEFVATDMVPAVPDSSLSDRLPALRRLTPSGAFRVASYTTCHTPGDVKSLQRTESGEDDEGCTLLLRDPRGLYEYAENSSTLVVRATYEATMAMHGLSKRCRALVLRGIGGETQVVRCSQAVFDEPPAKGVVVTVGHYGVWKSTGKVKFPYFIGYRPDLMWESVVKERNSARQQGE